MCVCVQSLSCVWFFATPWTVAHQVPLSKGFPRQEHWSRLPFPSSGELPDPRTELISPALNSYLLHWQVNSWPPSHLSSPDLVIIHSVTITHDWAKLETQKIFQVEKMKSCFYIFLMTHRKKNDKDVFIYKYYNLLKILHSWVFLLEFKPFYSGKVSGWKGKSHGQYSLFFYWLTVSS